MIIQLALIILSYMEGPMLIDFGNEKTNSWFALNDTVMGGRSAGKASYEGDVLRFEGNVSFENNGGFASVRSTIQEMDLSSFSRVVVRYRSANQSLSLNFNYYQQWYLPNYKAVLPETGMDWKEVSVALDDLKEYRIGQPTGNKITRDKLERIIRLGLMTNSKKEGPFSAEIDFIRFE